MSMNDFEIIKQLGKGAFSVVLLVRRKEDNNIYAIKRVTISNMNEKEKLNALNEVRLLASISHQNIIGYKESFFEDSTQTLNIVLEYADDGDLRTKIQLHQKSKKYFKENEIWSIFIQLMQGLRVLHNHHVMHRDLKTANIFLNKNGICKLGDLNVSKVVKMGLLYTQTGTPYYASPEVWADKPYDYKSDIWSIGCILYELCTLSLPFKGKNLCIVYQNISKGKYAPIPSIYSRDLAIIINCLLQVNPKNRPSCDELMKNPLIKKKIQMIFGQISDEDMNSSSLYKFKNEQIPIAYSKSMKNKDVDVDLLGTIRINNNNDIKKVLPQYKKYKSNNNIKHLRCYTNHGAKINSNEVAYSYRNVNNFEMKNYTSNNNVPEKGKIIGRNVFKKHNSLSNIIDLIKQNSKDDDNDDEEKKTKNTKKKDLNTINAEEINEKKQKIIEPFIKERCRTPCTKSIKIAHCIKNKPINIDERTIDHENEYEEENPVEEKIIERYLCNKNVRRTLQPQNINSYRENETNEMKNTIGKPPRPQSCGKRLIPKGSGEINPFSKITINPFKIMDNPNLRKILPPHMQFKLNNLRNLTNCSTITNSNNNTMESSVKNVKI